MTEPVAIVSADCHIGPRLVEDLRPLCPPELLDAFDAYVADPDRSKGRYVEHDADESEADPDDLTLWRNQFTAGHHDPATRRREMDLDGVAAEVVYHGSQNNEPVPFQTSMLGPADDPALYAAGIRIYNTWLAETCAAHPDRHVGLAHLPIWDVEASRGRAALGRRRRAPRRELPGAPPLADSPTTTGPGSRSGRRPRSSRCRSAPTPGAGDPAVFQGPELTALMSIESGGWFSRRAAHLLIFAGVFERHPELRLVLTEQPGEWWPAMADELDSGAPGQHRVGWPAEEAGAPRARASTSTATSGSAPASSPGPRPTARSATATPTG